MARSLRVGGRGTDPGGASAIWSVAEGRRGRRWREVRMAGEGIAHSLLLETDPAGRFSHLELSTPSGLLTLHPEGDGTLHGHAVVDAGIEHVRGLRWEPDAVPLLDGSTVCRLAAIALLEPSIATASSAGRLAVVIPATLRVEVTPVRIERLADRTWRFGTEAPISVDGRGLAVLAAGETWPLED